MKNIKHWSHSHVRPAFRRIRSTVERLEDRILLSAEPLIAFNRADGEGFRFLAEFVKDLDTRNPQTASRLLVSFRSWRALEPGRRALAEAALKTLADVPDLSADLRDIVGRMLA